MIKLGLPKGRMMSQSRQICSAFDVEMMPGILRYDTAVAGQRLGIYLLKAPDIARLIKENILDFGLTGDEWLLEHNISREQWSIEAGSYVASVCLLMAMGDRRPIQSARSVVTPYPNLARTLVTGLVPGSRIMKVAGSSEALVPDIGDACLDLVETGGTAALNGLVVRHTFGQVTTHIARSDRVRPEILATVLGMITPLAESRP